MDLQPSGRSLVIAVVLAMAAAVVGLLAVGDAGGAGGEPRALTVAASDTKPVEPLSDAARAMVTATTAWLPGAILPTAVPTSEPVGDASPTTRPATTGTAASGRSNQVDPSPSVASSSATSPPNLAGVTTTSVPVNTAAMISDASLASRIVAHHNRERAGRGLAPLQRSACLDGVAAAWAARLAVIGELRHNPSSAAQSGACVPWTSVGENVGFDGTVEAVDSAWMASVVHQANILNVDFSQIGVGVVHHDDFIWVVVNFVG